MIFHYIFRSTRRRLAAAFTFVLLVVGALGAFAPPAEAHSSGGVWADRRHVARRAKSQLGKPYAWGKASPKKGFDCSGLTRWSYGSHGYDLPHSSLLQYRLAGTSGYKRIEKRSRLAKGDLVFFDTSKKSKVGHVGIYIGDGKMVSATTSGVKIDSVYDKYYWGKRYVGATRILR